MKTVFTCLVVVMIASIAFAGNPVPGNVYVYAPDDNVFGMSYGDWEAAWWQWALTIPASQNPLTGNATDCFAGQTSGPVLFLGGSAGSGPVSHDCIAPFGKSIFVPIINTECSSAPVDVAGGFDGTTPQKAHNCAGEWVDGVAIQTLKATIDNHKVFNLDAYRAPTPYFYFLQPQGDGYLGDGFSTIDLPGWTYGYAVSDGYWLMIKPLCKGKHVIHLQAAMTSGPGAGFAQDLTFNITVQ